MIKQNFMFRLLPVCTALLLLSFSMPATHKQADKPLFGTKWILQSVHDGQHDFTPAGSSAFIRLDAVKNSAGGKGGCNSFGSTVKVEGDKISFSELFSTKMFCEGIQQIEDAYFNALSKATRYHISGDKLVIFQDGQEVLVFVAVGDF